MTSSHTPEDAPQPGVDDTQLILAARRLCANSSAAAPRADAQATCTTVGAPRDGVPAKPCAINPPSLDVPIELIAKELGSVRLAREIGRGGMGAVFLGHDELLRRDVAVKFLLNAISGPSDPGFAFFLQGARAAARVRHAGLTTIHQAGLIDGIPYLIMEYVAGPTLADVLRTGRLGHAAALAAITATAEAVAALHEADIVHRDIKSSNVLLDPDGRPYVTDFGLSLDRSSSRDGSARSVAGTLAYMAPEMFAGDVSPRSDVYALGIMGYELLVGELPFRAATAAEWVKAHAEQELPVEPMHAAGVEAALIEVLERATHKNAMFRYKTAGQFLRAVQEACGPATDATRGTAELAARTRGTDPTRATPAPSSASRGSSYYDELHEKASVVRTSRSAAPVAETEAPTVEPENSAEAETILVPGMELLSSRERRTHGVLVLLAAVGIVALTWQTQWLIISIVFSFPLVVWALLLIAPKWMSARSSRLYVHLYPELLRFPSATTRSWAWFDAVQKTRRSGRVQLTTIAFAILCFLGVNGLVLLLRAVAPALGVLGNLDAFAGLFCPLIAAIVLHGFWARRVRRELRSSLVSLNVPICTQCGYDLRGAGERPCPECGTAPIHSAARDQAEVQRDVAEAERARELRRRSNLWKTRVGVGLIVVMLPLMMLFLTQIGRPRTFRGSREVQVLLDRAYGARTAGDFSAAADSFREALEAAQRAWPQDRGPWRGDIQRDLGKALTDLQRFADAESALLEADRVYRDASSADAHRSNDLAFQLMRFYKAWDAAEPGKGHAEQAAQWREKLKP